MTRTIRDCRPNDHETLRAIQSTVLDEPSPNLLAAATEGPLIGLVCLADDVIVGYVLAVLGDSRAYLPELAVALDSQGEGHGTALLEEICRRYRPLGIDTLGVTTRADGRAREFYESRGFEVVDRVPEYYEDGAAGIVYRRQC